MNAQMTLQSGGLIGSRTIHYLFVMGRNLEVELKKGVRLWGTKIQANYSLFTKNLVNWVRAGEKPLIKK